MSGPSTTLSRLRYPLLAATVAAAIAVPQWVGASDRSADGRIVVAQNDASTNKGKPPAAKGNTATPGAQPGGQPRQGGNPPPTNNQRFQQGQSGQTGTGQKGTGQTGTGQRGPAQTGNSQTGTGQRGLTGTGQTGSGQTGTGQQGTGQKKDTTRTGPGNQFQQQGGTGQQGTSQGGQGLPKTMSKQGTGNPFQKGPSGQQNATGQQGGQQRTFGRPDATQQNLQNRQVGSIDQLRSQRQTVTDASGRTVIKEGNRSIVRDGNRTIIRSDDNDRFARFGNGRVERRGNDNATVFTRPGGVSIVNVTDRSGNLITRSRRGPDGREVILIDNRRRGIGPGGVAGLAVGALAAGVFLGLAAPQIIIPRDQYIVDMDVAPPGMLYDALDAPPLMDMERAYTLDEIRYNVELRDRMRRIDINTINFDTGSWTVTPDQYDRLAAVADAMNRVLRRHPDEIFMIEGHTDAVGNDVDNLTLSDRRAESVASILTEYFHIPPENLVTQGYGAQYLKVQTPDALRANRRVAVRRIGPLLAGRAY